jgi:hypothetical protein
VGSDHADRRTNGHRFTARRSDLERGRPRLIDVVCVSLGSDSAITYLHTREAPPTGAIEARGAWVIISPSQEGLGRLPIVVAFLMRSSPDGVIGCVY